VAVRRAFLAFGLGTALCVFIGLGSSYAISSYWEVYTVRDLSIKLGQVCVEKKEQIMHPFTDTIPEYTRSTKKWMASTRLGQFLHIAPPAAAGQQPHEQQQLTAAEELELDLLSQETARLEREWEDSWSGKAQAKKDAEAAARKQAKSS
jgi:hypothetical protein